MSNNLNLYLNHTDEETVTLKLGETTPSVEDIVQSTEYNIKALINHNDFKRIDCDTDHDEYKKLTEKCIELIKVRNIIDEYLKNVKEELTSSYNKFNHYS